MQLSDLVCPDCGAQSVWWFDASLLREREFEGVFFEVLEQNGKLVVRGRDEDADYLNDFNMKKLTREAAEVVSEYLRGEQDPTHLYCPQCLEPMA